MTEDRKIAVTSGKKYSQGRRNFLIGLKKWSKVVIAGVITGVSLVHADREAAAWRRRKKYVLKSGLGEPWANGGRKWANRGGDWSNAAWADSTERRWTNGNKVWANRAWANGTSKWANNGQSWVNRY